MSIETRLIRIFIGWLNRRYPFLMLDAVLGENFHKNANPRKKNKAVADHA